MKKEYFSIPLPEKEDEKDFCCLIPQQIRQLAAHDIDVNCHLYFCVRCYRLVQEKNPEYLNLFENTEKEWERKFRLMSNTADKDFFLYQITRFGLIHLSDREIVDFNFLEEEFDPEYLICIYEHLAECFRCRSKCRKLTCQDFCRVYPSRFRTDYVERIFGFYQTDEETVFSV